MVGLNPTVVAILEAYLEEHGYDGLYTHGCSCEIDDLMPCFETVFACRAGYKHECTDPECDFADEQHWYIGPEKEGA